MQSPDRKIDATIQSYTKSWMDSLDHPRTFTTLGYFFVGLFILFWSSSLTSLIGYDVNKGYGASIFVIIGLTLTLTTIFLNKLMSKIGLDRPIRSALLFSALVGPYVFLTTYNSWNLPVISHIVGFFASILTFIFSYLLDTALGRYLKRSR